MPTILVADDTDDARKMMEKILLDAGYGVVSRASPEAAKGALDEAGIDVAILDYKLRDGTPADKSGVWVAKNSDSRIPKIMVSDKADEKEIMAAVDLSQDGLPLIVKFVPKDEFGYDSPDSLINAVRQALLTAQVWRRQSRESLSEILKSQEKDIRWMDRAHSLIHWLSSVVFLILMAKIVWKIDNEYSLGAVFIFVALLGGELVTYFLARRGHLASSRADKYHSELIQISRFEQLLASCTEIEDKPIRDQARLQLIMHTNDLWFRGELQGASSLLLDEAQNRQ